MNQDLYKFKKGINGTYLLWWRKLVMQEKRGFRTSPSLVVVVLPLVDLKNSIDKIFSFDFSETLKQSFHSICLTSFLLILCTCNWKIF